MHFAIKRKVGLMALLLMLGIGAATAQTATTIQQINALAAAQLDSLVNMGAGLAEADIQRLVKSPFENQSVKVVAVVMTDPNSSGLSSFDSDRGGPGRIHVFIRDTSAVSNMAGSGIQIVDGAYEDNNTLDLAVGDVIEVVGNVTYFFKTMQLAPTSIQVLGSLGDFGIPNSILDPVDTTTADLATSLGDGTFQTNWANYPSLNDQFVEIKNATVLTRTIGDRPDWSITTDGGATRIYIYDISLRYRNDRDGSYPNPPYNVRDNDFEPPPIGSVINLKGFINLQGDDPDGISVPARSVLSINPFEDDHLTILESPPQVAAPSRPGGVPGSDPVTITADIVADASRNITGVVLNYFFSSDEENVQMVNMTTSNSASKPCIAAIFPLRPMAIL